MKMKTIFLALAFLMAVSLAYADELKIKGYHYCPEVI